MICHGLLYQRLDTTRQRMARLKEKPSATNQLSISRFGDIALDSHIFQATFYLRTDEVMSDFSESRVAGEAGGGIEKILNGSIIPMV